MGTICSIWKKEGKNLFDILNGNEIRYGNEIDARKLDRNEVKELIRECAELHIYEPIKTLGLIVSECGFFPLPADADKEFITLVKVFNEGCKYGMTCNDYHSYCKLPDENMAVIINSVWN